MSSVRFSLLRPYLPISCTMGTGGVGGVRFFLIIEIPG